MVKVVFSCSENMKRHEEEMEFEEGITEEQIEEEWKEWVWEQVVDYYSWYRK